MPCFQAFRRRSLLVFFVTNVAFFVLNLALLARGTWIVEDRAKIQAAKDAEQLGMMVGFERSPLSLFVAKEFPKDDTFRLFDSRRALLASSASVDPTDAGGASDEASIALGEDFGFRCFYSSVNPPRIHELWLELKDESLFDLNADGVFDVRLHAREAAPRYPPQLEVLYGGVWCETVNEEGWTKYRKKLQDGTIIMFDRARGTWVAL